ncbi:hypothetical protein Q8F55_003295 [Vanrija albida]|uniref:Uncharacterized protein n=1 Tax=Vanrija albida TaxID=181172 RepID=A0ABR3Q3K2_9TREE
MSSTLQHSTREVRFADGTRPFKLKPAPEPVKPALMTRSPRVYHLPSAAGFQRASNSGLPRSPACFDLAAVLSSPDFNTASDCTPREYVPRDPRIGQKPRPTALLTPPPSP